MKVPSEGRGIVTPATGVVCDGETHGMDAGNQSWSLEKQQVLLTAELALYPCLGILFKEMYSCSRHTGTHLFSQHLGEGRRIRS